MTEGEYEGGGTERGSKRKQGIKKPWGVGIGVPGEAGGAKAAPGKGKEIR